MDLVLVCECVCCRAGEVARVTLVAGRTDMLKYDLIGVPGFQIPDHLDETDSCYIRILRLLPVGAENTFSVFSTARRCREHLQCVFYCP